jgi:putative ABC transport system substrate-binding protein
MAAKAATSTVPIVFVIGADPVKLKVVASLSHPGGNLTGISQFFGALGAKRLELLTELKPGANSIAVVSNPKNANSQSHLQEIQTAAHAINKQVQVFTASSEAQIDAAFSELVRARAGALLVADDPLFNARSKQFVALAARYKLPAIYYLSSFTEDGGLISYGSNNAENYRQGGVYAGKILKGANPADLPILQPTQFELVVNKRTANTLGLKIPDSILLRADRVIE